MPAYIIAIRKDPIHNEKAMTEYQRRTREIAGEFPLIPLVVYGNTEGLEGETPDGVVLMEFPSMEEAKAWYYNDAYQKAAEFRKKAADYQMFIVEGLNRSA